MTDSLCSWRKPLLFFLRTLNICFMKVSLDQVIRRKIDELSIIKVDI